MNKNNVLMVSAENGFLEGAKVGGVADVISGIVPALLTNNVGIQMILPSYGIFHKRKGMRHAHDFKFKFAGETCQVALYQGVLEDYPKADLWILDHALFASCGDGKIYCDDPPETPFAQDATKFALYCNAVMEVLEHALMDCINVVHLHDWHTAFMLLLKAYDARYKKVKKSRRFVFSIHNLAYQGVRPKHHHESSLVHWWPHIANQTDTKIQHIIEDNRWTDCINPMAIGVRLADGLHTVSESYCDEICQPSRPEDGFIGGESLEYDLLKAREEARLVGILNGCDYSPTNLPKPLNWKSFLRNALEYTKHQIQNNGENDGRGMSTHFVTYYRLNQWSKKAKPAVLLTSVSRINDQKIRLFAQSTQNGSQVANSALQLMLKKLNDLRNFDSNLTDLSNKSEDPSTTDNSGLYLFIGSGDPQLEAFLTQVMARNENFIFINGFSISLSDQLYSQGDLFIMPSLYEPCGISQMLAMRSGQPVLAHAIGGLKDTIEHHETGFLFSGKNNPEQIDNMLKVFSNAVRLKLTDKKKWQIICKNAAEKRFSWNASAQKYIHSLYDLNIG